VRYHSGALRPLAAACREIAASSAAALALHLDHVDDDALLRGSADAGFSSVMFDAGALPYADNVAATQAAAQWAHGAGLWIEAELGYVGGKASQPLSAHAVGVRTDPAEAADFVAQTGVDALAVAVGSTHAMTQRSTELDCALVGRLAAAVPVPLVLHGSSGVTDASLRAAVGAGITKVNVGTLLNVAFTSAVRAHVGTAGADPRPYLGAARDAMTAAAEHILTLI
jgi:fructose-bisphosphate aldolase class II